jgi:hypothetical protein
MFFRYPNTVGEIIFPPFLDISNSSDKIHGGFIFQVHIFRCGLRFLAHEGKKLSDGNRLIALF